MLYLIIPILPPLAVLLGGMPLQAAFNLVICIVSIWLMIKAPIFVIFSIPMWIAAMIHAAIVINGKNKDRRVQRMVAGITAKNAS